MFAELSYFAFSRSQSRLGNVRYGSQADVSPPCAGPPWPNSVLGPGRVGLWVRTLAGAGGGWIQADRGALPAQAVFLVGGERDAYLAGEPADDARFVAVFAHGLEHAGGYTPEEARRVARTLLPDILSYDPRRAASFPRNGRTLTDDAADAFLAVFTNGKVTGDRVGPHGDLLVEFPYLGSPHNA